MNSPAHVFARTFLGLSTAAAMMATSFPLAAAPPRGGTASSSAPPSTAPTGAGAGGPELSGDEAGVANNNCKKIRPNDRFKIALPPEVELQQLVKWMSTITCQNFIWNTKIRSGKVTILAPEKVNIREAYAAFYAAIESMGLTVEPAGSYFKIVETPDAKNLPLYPDGRAVPNNDRFVTQLVRVKNAPVADIADVANKLKTKQGEVQVVGNLLIITDRGSVVRRMMKIVNELDRFGSGEKIFFYQLQYADANEVAEIIRDIFGENQAKPAAKKKSKNSKDVTDSTFSRVIVDDRTGTIIIVASDSDYQTILRLIKQLDVRLPGGGGRIHVRKLRNADPQDVATVLQNLAQGGAAGGGGGEGAGKNKGATQGGAAAELFSGEVKVTADEATRSLVIIASAADYKSLEAVIDELDAERKQVYLEIYLLEATVSRDVTVGAGAHGGGTFDTAQGQGFGVVSSAPSPDVNSVILSPNVLQGLAGGVFGPLVPGSGQFLGIGQDVPAFGVVIQAIQRNQDVNVVAQPHIYTADNQEAQIEIGRRVPTPGALSFGAGGQASLTPLQSINREDVTLNIKVTPHVNDESTVTLDVELEDRDIVSTDPTLGVTTTQRRLKLDQILARDDQPVVLGGLVRELEREVTNQVPGLGSIPILGWLFKRRQKIKEKVNLLIIMVPHVIETPDDIRRVHERRTRERIEFLERESSFKRHELPANVDYRHKSGLLSSVDREARRLEHEELILRQAEEELSGERVTGEIGASFRATESDAVGSDAATPKARASTKSKNK